jgi:hypothetical protein
MPRNPEEERPGELPHFPFLLSSRFDSRESSQQPYDTIQAIVHDKQTIADFSVLRFIQNWPESMAKAPPSTKRWYVATIGDTPPEPIADQVRNALNTGEPVPLPDEVIAELTRKRVQEIAKRPYTEIHRTFTVFRREDHQKEKMRRKIQKQSRRKNRRK